MSAFFCFIERKMPVLTTPIRETVVAGQKRGRTSQKANLAGTTRGRHPGIGKATASKIMGKETSPIPAGTSPTTPVGPGELPAASQAPLGGTPVKGRPAGTKVGKEETGTMMGVGAFLPGNLGAGGNGVSPGSLPQWITCKIGSTGEGIMGSKGRRRIPIWISPVTPCRSATLLISAKHKPNKSLKQTGTTRRAPATLPGIRRTAGLHTRQLKARKWDPKMMTPGRLRGRIPLNFPASPCP